MISCEGGLGLAEVIKAISERCSSSSNNSSYYYLFGYSFTKACQLLVMSRPKRWAHETEACIFDTHSIVSGPGTILFPLVIGVQLNPGI